MMNRQKKAGPSQHNRDGPLVPLSGERFRVAVDESGLGLAGLVRALNKGRRPLDRSFKQTLHHHYQGKGSRIRAKVRERLAQVLDSPEDWLAGEEVQPPLGLYLRLLDPMRRSLRVQFAVTRLAWRCLEGVERDLAGEPSRPPTAEGYEPRLLVHQAIGSTLARLINVVRGVPRLVSLRPHLYSPAGPPPVQAPDEPWPIESPLVGLVKRGSLTPAVEQAYLAAILVVSDLLEPWLVRGEALNYRGLMDVAEAVDRGGTARSAPNFGQASSVESGGREPTPSTSPYALIDWPAMEASGSAGEPSPSAPAKASGGSRQPRRRGAARFRAALETGA